MYPHMRTSKLGDREVLLTLGYIPHQLYTILRLGTGIIPRSIL